MQEMKVKLTGIAPLICHNNQGVDPLNYFSIEMKKLTGKRGKTPSDLEQLSKIEFFAGLYLQDDTPVLPAKMFAATFIAGAKKDKNGPYAKSGVFFSEHSPIIYDGPKTSGELYADGRFTFRCPVKVGQSTVIRVRPKFDDWAIIIPFEYDESVIEEATIMLAWEKAGHVVGMGDWRPQHGRFSVQRG